MGFGDLQAAPCTFYPCETAAVQRTFDGSIPILSFIEAAIFLLMTYMSPQHLQHKKCSVYGSYLQYSTSHPFLSSATMHPRRRQQPKAGQDDQTCGYTSRQVLGDARFAKGRNASVTNFDACGCSRFFRGVVLTRYDSPIKPFSGQGATKPFGISTGFFGL